MLFELFETMLILTCLMETMKCSVVLDRSSQSQKGIYMEDYCPKMKYCAEGSHVMCMQYNPRIKMGSQCHHPRNVSITPELANRLLDVSNAMRSKIARGLEKGKNGEKFPRGYGIFRLKWDTELATFAQVLANQCVLRHDLCRATKRFPSPGQTVGLIRFSDPDWIPLSKSSNLTTPGLDNEKLMHAATKSLKAWYGQKRSITYHMLNNSPDWTLDPRNAGKLYLEMIYGPSTHMGCGISAFREYAYRDNITSLHYNSVLVICNFSGRPKQGAAVYNTVPPTDTASTFNQCGCPAGSVEDDDCLCNEVPTELVPEPLNVPKPRKCGNTKNCEPTVVLLPIFTVEDAPPEKLIYPERFLNSSSAQIRRMAADSFENVLDNNVSGYMKRMHESTNTEDHSNTGSNDNKQRAIPHNHVSVRIRHFDKNQNDRINHETTNDDEDGNPRKSFSSHLPRPIIFAKTTRFELPGTRNFWKIGVLPRKNFPKLTKKSIVGKYSFIKKSIALPKEEYPFTRNNENPMPDATEINSVEMLNQNHDLQKYLHPNVQTNTNIYHKYAQFNDIITTESVLNTAEQRVINHNDQMKDLNITHDFDKIDTTTTEENDKILMDLLDTLEQAVKHVELRDEEKLIVDAKLKKIYGKIIGPLSKTLDFNEDKHEKLYVTKPELTYEPKLETKRTSKQKAKQETNREMKLETKDELKLDLEHESTHEPTHLDLDLESNKNKKKSKDNKEHVTFPKDDNSVHNLAHRKFNYENDISDQHINHIEPHDDIHDLGMEGFENTLKHDSQSNDFEFDHLNKRPMSKYNKNGDKSHLRYRQNIRQRQNDVDSLEYFRNPYDDNGYRERKSRHYNRHFERNMLRNDIENPKHRSNSLDHRFSRRSRGFDWDDDPLSEDRRQYYQDKLDDMERRLHNVRHNTRRKDENRPRHLRAMRPRSMQSEHQMDSIKTTRRARFLNGY